MNARERYEQRVQQVVLEARLREMCAAMTFVVEARRALGSVAVLSDSFGRISTGVVSEVHEDGTISIRWGR